MTTDSESAQPVDVLRQTNDRLEQIVYRLQDLVKKVDEVGGVVAKGDRLSARCRERSSSTSSISALRRE